MPASGHTSVLINDCGEQLQMHGSVTNSMGRGGPGDCGLVGIGTASNDMRAASNRLMGTHNRDTQQACEST